jgi:GH15 family glucan-1,4-alpha-glucosidase
MYNFGLIGNCQVSALISTVGDIAWYCLPRPDAPPIFGALLDPEAGQLSVSLEELADNRQSYVRNTNILVTTLTASDGSELEITDFCPRFEQNGRMYRPAVLHRMIRPTKGSARVKVICSPILGWEKQFATPRRTNSHLKYTYPTGCLRIYTNMPMTYLLQGNSFLLQEDVFISIVWDSRLESDIRQATLDALDRTENYWRRWVKHLSIPTLFQEEVIRSALVLKLHCYEDTGAIIAATTTSLPEELMGQRNWDYRYCWLRDAFFTLSAFNHLSHFEEMEGFLRFLLDLVNYRDDLAPVYSIDRQLPIPEITHKNWRGYSDSLPVRSNNAAANQVQHDVYGELILALAPIYLDERFHHLRSSQLDKTIYWLAQRCCESIGKPDAGIWELRGIVQEHTFTNAMCWAGVNRVVGMIERGKLSSTADLPIDRLKNAEKFAIERINAAVVGEVVTNSPQDMTLDASLLLLPILRFPDQKLSAQTLKAIATQLQVRDSKYDNFIYRYRRDDDFGSPNDPFVICSFWLAQAYARMGESERGIEILDSVLCASNHLGLFSEHFSPKNQIQLGNFPQAYSHVGLINAAFSVSPSWQEVL